MNTYWVSLDGGQFDGYFRSYFSEGAVAQACSKRGWHYTDEVYAAAHWGMADDDDNPFREEYPPPEEKSNSMDDSAICKLKAIEVEPGWYAFKNAWNRFSKPWLTASKENLSRIVSEMNCFDERDPYMPEGLFSEMPFWWEPEQRTAFAVGNQRFAFDATEGNETGQAGDDEHRAHTLALQASNGKDFKVVTADLKTGAEIAI